LAVTANKPISVNAWLVNTSL